jgi:hypothetical protein
MTLRQRLDNLGDTSSLYRGADPFIVAEGGHIAEAMFSAAVRSYLIGPEPSAPIRDLNLSIGSSRMAAAMQPRPLPSLPILRLLSDERRCQRFVITSVSNRIYTNFGIRLGSSARCFAAVRGVPPALALLAHMDYRACCSVRASPCSLH